MKIESLKLNWSEGQLINTRRGERLLRKASPGPAFWSAWKSDKQAIKDLGLEVDKPAGVWTVLWWSDPSAPMPEPEAPANAIIPVLPEPEVVAITAEICATANGVNWSDEQLAIFNWFKTGTGNLVIQARAGTGKTTTIKQAFTYAPEAEILYAVFNKKNQREAAEKITDTRVDVRTLHSLGFSFIQAVWPGVQPDDTVERERIQSASEGIPDDAAGTVEKLVGFAKNTQLAPTVESLIELANDRGIFCGLESEEDGGWTVAKIATVALRVLELSKERSNRISFNDMVWLPVVKNWVTPRYNLVCVDEAQDMNLPQLEIAIRACRSGGRIAIVGDDRQAIYGFRGAASDGMGMMKTRLNAATLGLTTTYRCPKSVVAIAASIVTDYHAAPEAPEGIVDSTPAVTEQVAIGDAVLSRLNAPLMSTCLAILRRGISARIEGRDIGKQLCGMVRKLKAKSVPDFCRKLNAWGDKQIARVNCGKNAEAKVALVRDQVETLAAVAEGCASVRDIETRLLSLFQDSDSNAKPAVVLSTVHKAKGLEWNRVFILRDTFKFKTDEDNNVWYVGVTRAKKHLTMVEA